MSTGTVFSRPVDMALWLLDQGKWPVVLHPRAKRPKGLSWGKRRPTENSIRAAFGRDPDANVGIKLGIDGRAIDIEVDALTDEERALADEILRDLFAGDLPATFGHHSKRGPHWIFEWDDRLLRFGRAIIHLGPVEIRIGSLEPGGQYQSVVAPSADEEGVPRTWNGIAAFARLPGSFFERLAARLAATEEPARDGAANGRAQPRGMRADDAGPYRKWFRAKLEAFAGKVAMARVGTRHDTLRDCTRAIAGYLGFGYLDEADIIAVMTDAGRRCGLPEGEILGTIADSIAHGRAHPCDWPRGLDPPGTHANGKYKPGGNGRAPADQEQTTERPRPFSLTDLGNAERLVARYGIDIRYVHPWKAWLAYDGVRWAIDNAARVRYMARQTVRAIYNEAADEPDDERRKELVKWGHASERSDRIRALSTLAEAERGIPVPHESLDRNPWLLNVPNGTLDLRTGTLRPHMREDMITKLCPVHYDPDAECPLWEKTLDRIFNGNSRLIEFLRRLCGYCLTGDVSEQILPIFWGSGANGKSTLLGMLMQTLGSDYAMKAPQSFLMVSKGERHPTELADLFGMRLVVAIETGEGARINEVLIKELTGGDDLRARRMRENFWQFSPTHKVLLCTNHKPAVKGTDCAIWRRIKLIPFEVRIPDEEQDKQLPQKLAGELPGILTWCVRGCQEWLESGLKPPQEVTDATREYRAAEDVLQSFIDECCMTGNDQFRVKASHLYDRYRKWTEGSGETPVPQKRFGAALTERGFARYTNNGTWYRGIGLRQGEAAAGPEEEDPYSVPF